VVGSLKKPPRDVNSLITSAGSRSALGPRRRVLSCALETEFANVVPIHCVLLKDPERIPSRRKLALYFSETDELTRGREEECLSARFT
jgi:hypothetical protein